MTHKYNKYLWFFWKRKIKAVKRLKDSPHPLTFDGKSLKDTLEERFSGERREFLKEMEQFAYETCQELYATATRNITPFPPTLDGLFNELPFDDDYGSFYEDYSKIKTISITNLNDFAKYYERKRDETEVKLDNFSTIFFSLWRVFGMGGGELKVNLPLEFKEDKKYKELEKRVFCHLKKEVLGGRKVAKILHNEARREHLLNKILGTTDLPRDWNKKLVKKADLDNLQTWKDNHVCSSAPCSVPCHTSSHSDYNQKHTESQEYQRINTKLSGKVSDPELQTLLDALPNCPHSDYDTLKSERDTLKTENTQLKDHKCDCDSKVAQKEKEIINKIITDLELSTERERENILEAVITEIKTKINPPQDNSQLSQLQTQLKNRETEISQLKKGNQSQLDLEKLIAQKQAQNQELTTAKSSLESQLNEKQKELLTQVLNKLSEVKEKTIKTEIIKVIETSLTSQGIDSQAFRKEINQLSSLTDIEKSQGKYTGQKINELKSSYKSATYLNIGLGVLSIGSLSVLAYLLIRMAKKDINKKLGDSK